MQGEASRALRRGEGAVKRRPVKGSEYHRAENWDRGSDVLQLYLLYPL
jgi:hypothetical protein